MALPASDLACLSLHSPIIMDSQYYPPNPPFSSSSSYPLQLYSFPPYSYTQDPCSPYHPQFAHHFASSSRLIRPLARANLSDYGHYQPHATPELDFPPSPSDTCSSLSTDISPSPSPDTVRIVCDIPLVAPRPLPYHSPTFLQFDLPDVDEDLSHPPYTQRPSKRKRTTDDDAPSAKRHAAKPHYSSHAQLPHAVTHPSVAHTSSVHHPTHRIRRR